MNLKKAVKDISNYVYLYEFIGKQPRTEEEIFAHIKEKKVVKSDLAMRNHKEAAISGQLEMISVKDDKAYINPNDLRNFVEGICKMAGTDAIKLFTGPAPMPKGKSDKTDTSLELLENPMYKELKKEKDKHSKAVAEHKAEVEALKKEIERLGAELVQAKMEQKVKIVPIQSIEVYGDAFEDDIFMYQPGAYMGNSYSISKDGGERESYYEKDVDKKNSFTIENLKRKLLAPLLSSRFFKKRYEDEVIADKKLGKAKDTVELVENSIVKNRRKSVEMLLSDNNLNNQMNLLKRRWLMRLN